MEIEMQEIVTAPTTMDESPIKLGLSSPNIYILPWLTKMEIELQESWGSVKADAGLDNHPRYTSLKDIIQLSAGPVEVSHELCDLGITIKNHLVKRAASAYLQSSPITPIRKRNCLGRLWQRLMKNQALARCWTDQVQDCRCYFARRISRFLTSMDRRLRVLGRR